MPLAQWTILVASLVAWSDTITIQPSRGDRSSGLQRSVAGLDRPSERTVETLRRFDLDKEYRHDVNAALQHLEKYAQRRAEPELVYALAELSWIEGKRLDRWRREPRRSTASSTPPPTPMTTSSTRARAGRGPQPLGPAVPPGLRDLQRRGRAPDPRGHDQGPDPAPERRGHHVQGPRPRAVAADRAPGFPLESGRRSQDPSGLRFRGHRPQQDLTSMAWACP